MLKPQLFKVLLMFVAVSTIMMSCKKDDDTVDTDIVGSITGNTTWTADKIWTITGFVVVESGATLNIEPGTIIKAAEGSGENSTALIVARGGTINAVGNATNPIIFTSVLDDIEVGQKTGTNLDQDDNGLWGGVIILGNAPISDGDGGAEGQIEGVPSDKTFGQYGGSNSSESSGSFRYVSIRHNGTALKPDEELQGLTLGGVGSGTVIDHVEVVASDDDGIEIFGGAVNLNDILILFQTDDGLDLDQSYSGTVDNLYIKHAGGGAGNAGFEFDGPEDSGVNAGGKFTVKNATVKNSGSAAGGAALLKSAAQGTIQDCAFIGYTNWVSVEGGSATGNYADGDLKIMNCEFSGSPLDALMTVVGADTTTSNDSIIVANFSLNAGNSGGVTTYTKGADNSEFTGWTWGNIKGLVD